LFVTDTGNKRVVVYDREGSFLFEFGGEGFDPGQFYEPVGLGFDASDRLFIADTWNARVQIMAEDAGGSSYSPFSEWEIHGWFGESLNNKPYLAVDPGERRVYVTDPEGARVLVFTTDGQFLHTFGDFGADASTFGVILGIKVDSEGGIWLVDSGNSRLMHFPRTEAATP
jgi:DNA-binding beta-propeller fold protein YncE